MKTAKSTDTTHKHPRASQPTPFKDESTFCAAYERRLSQIKAVPDEELFPVNLDVHATVTTVLGVLPELSALRKRMAELPEFDMKTIDSLEDYARAAGEANSRYATATAPYEDLPKLNQEALELRETLRSDATALANRGLIDPTRLTPFKGLVGYKNVAFELIDWANLLRDCWKEIQGKTALQADEVQHAKQVAERLVLAAGHKEQGPAVVVETARIRQQAFTLLVNGYNQARRAISFLRWDEDDIETLAPSLYAGRGGRGKGTPAPAPGTPVTTPATPGAGAPVTVTAPASVTPAQPAIAIAKGLPGASPFAST